MSDSRQKHEDAALQELEQLRDRFANQINVKCATGEEQLFNFKDIDRRDINFSQDGKNIRAVARIKGGLERKVCYLKFCNQYATIIRFAEDKIAEHFSELNNVEHIVLHKDKTIAKVNNPDFNIGNYATVNKPKNLTDMTKEELNLLYPETPEQAYAYINIESPFNNKSYEYSRPLVRGMHEYPDTSEEIKEEGVINPEFEKFVDKYLDGLKALIKKKNRSYGNAALNPIRIFSKADSAEQIKVRLDDKINRILQGNDSFNEDTIQDFQGYLVLLQFKKSQE